MISTRRLRLQPIRAPPSHVHRFAARKNNAQRNQAAPVSGSNRESPSSKYERSRIIRQKRDRLPSRAFYRLACYKSDCARRRNSWLHPEGRVSNQRRSRIRISISSFSRQGSMSCFVGFVKSWIKQTTTLLSPPNPSRVFSPPDLSEGYMEGIQPCEMIITKP